MTWCHRAWIFLFIAVMPAKKIRHSRASAGSLNLNALWPCKKLVWRYTVDCRLESRLYFFPGVMVIGRSTVREARIILRTYSSLQLFIAVISIHSLKGINFAIFSTHLSTFHCKHVRTLGFRYVSACRNPSRGATSRTFRIKAERYNRESGFAQSDKSSR